MDFNDKKENLNDIIVENEDDNKSKSKKTFFATLGLIVVVALLSIISWALLSKDDAKTEISVAQLPNETTIQDDNISSVLETNETNVSEANASEGIDAATKQDKFEQIVQDIKAKQEKEKAKAKESGTTAKDLIKENKKESNVSVNTKAAKPTNVKAQEPAKTDVKEAFKDSKTTSNGTVATKGHYLQVGAFSAAPNKDFVNKISKYGYRIQTINLANGSTATRYLIGPYDSRTEANRDILQITTEITKPVYYEVK